MSFSINGKTAIVTGAAGGVGHAIARHFLSEGANVVFADISEKRLKSSCDDLSDHENARLFVGDLREKLHIANLLSTTIDAFEQIDILVNATRAFMTTDPLDASDTTVEQSIGHTLNTALRLSQAVARRMISQVEKAETRSANAGTIVNLGSVVTRHTQQDLMGFSIGNAALEQMTRSLALALAPHSIRVNTIALGSIMTGSLRDALAEHPEYRDGIQDGTPMHRIGTATEVAETAQFLASSSSSFMTGQILTLDGGRTLLDPVRHPAH